MTPDTSVRKSGSPEVRKSRLLWSTSGLLLFSLVANVAWSVEVSPGLDPAPHVEPLVPTVDDPATMTPADRLQRRLESLIRERDQRIRDLLLARENLRPTTGAPSDPALAQPTREREQARLDLRRALEAYDERASSNRQDVLDATRPLAQAVQRSTLAATNQLRIAECYHDLAATGTPSPADLAAGLKALGLVEVADLGDGEPVRLRYLQAWFLIEQTRQASGDSRAKLLTSATAAVERLAQEHPTSELVIAARGLLAGLDLPGTELLP